MIGALRKAYHSFRGSGEASLTIPALDGAFRPNQAIENAPVLAKIEQPDNLTSVGDEIHFSSGPRWHRLGRNGQVELIEAFARPITAMACDGRGRVAIAFEGGAVISRGGSRENIAISSPDGGDVVSLAFDGAGTLCFSVGAANARAADWRRDLMERGCSGAIWRYEIASQQLGKLADKLAYPSGIVAADAGSLVVSEAWRHRIVRLRPGREAEVMSRHLPGYPSRIISSGKGGYWLAAMAPRNQLVEFVLREETYRRRMIDEIDPSDWIAPALAPPVSFLQPMQQGGQRTLSILKPWAPSLSYGLVIRLDADGGPVESFHSRADGQRHGVTSLLERGGELIVSSRGGGVIINLPISEETSR